MYHLRLRSYPLDRKTATTNHPTDQSACDTQLYERSSLLVWLVAATSLHIIIAFGAIVRRISSPAFITCHAWSVWDRNAESAFV